MIRLYRHALPDQVPAAVFRDGDNVAVVINPNVSEKNSPDWMYGVVNSLLAEATEVPEMALADR